MEATTEGLLAPDRRPLTIGLVMIITLAAFEALAVATIMPVVQEDLGGLRLYGLVFGAFMTANVVGIVVAGRLADEVGPGRPFATALVLFGIGLAVAGVAPEMAVLVVARAVQGLGAGGISTSVFVLIGRGYPEDLRPRMFTVLSSAWVTPGLIGPAVSAAVADNLSWRLVFLGLLPLLPLVAALTLPHVRSIGPVRASEEPAAYAGPGVVVRLALGSSLALAGLAVTVLPLAVGLVVVGVFVGAPALGKLLPAGSFRASRGIPAVVAVAGLLVMAFFGAEAFLPLLLKEVRGQSTTFAGLTLTCASVTWMTGAWLHERAVGRVPRRTVAVAGLGFVLLGLLVAGAVVFEEAPAWLALAGWTVGGLGMGLAYSALMVLGLAQAPEASVGSYSASIQLANVLGSAVGASVGGAILAAGDSLEWSTATSIGVIFALAAVVAALNVGVGMRLPGEGTPA